MGIFGSRVACFFADNEGSANQPLNRTHPYNTTFRLLGISPTTGGKSPWIQEQYCKAGRVLQERSEWIRLRQGYAGTRWIGAKQAAGNQERYCASSPAGRKPGDWRQVARIQEQYCKAGRVLQVRSEGSVLEYSTRAANAARRAPAKQDCSVKAKKMEPIIGIEPMTYSLRVNCSTD